MINNNQLIALLSLGVDIKNIIKIIFFISIFLSCFLLFLSILLIPYSDYQFRSFKESKLKNYNININLSDSVQINNNYFYIKSKENTRYQDIFIYRKLKNNHQIIIAANMKIVNNNINKIFLFKKVKIFDFSKNQSINTIYDKFTFEQKIQSLQKNIFSLKKYWLNDEKRLLSIIYLSFTPIIFMNIMLSFSIYNKRYDKNYSYITIFTSAIFIYIVVEFIKLYGNYFNLSIILILTYLIGLFLIKNRVLNKF